MMHAVVAALVAIWWASSASAQSATGSEFAFTIRHETDRGATTRTGTGVVSGERARLTFSEISGDASRSPIRPGTAVLITAAGDPVESLVVVSDSARMIMRPARMLAEMRRMISSIPRAPKITATLLSMRADTSDSVPRIGGLPARRYRSRGEVLVVFSASDPAIVHVPDTMRVTLEAEAFHSWAAPGAVDPFRGVQSLDLLLGAQAGGDPTIAAELTKILAPIPHAVPLRSSWSVSVTQHGRTRTEREVVELSRVGNAAVDVRRLAIPDYPEASAGRP